MTAAACGWWRRVRHTRLRDALRGRFDASLDWRAVIAGADLPIEVRGVIEQVVRRTRLWRRERVEIAEELVAHFLDGIESGVSPAELVKSFGDPQQTARLMRRAKKRGRPMVWQVWRCACWALGFIVAAYVVMALWMMLDRPTVKVDYLAMINERANSAPESERAWPLYREALLGMGRLLEQPLPAEYDAAITAKPGDANWKTAEQFLKEHAPDVERIRTAAAKRELGLPAKTAMADYSERDRKLFAVPPIESAGGEPDSHASSEQWLISTLLMDVQLLHEVGQLLATDARRAAAADDGKTALADVVAMLRVARHVEEKPFFVSLLVSARLHSEAFSLVQEIMQTNPALWSDDELRNLAHRVAVAKVDWRRGFIGESAGFHDSMQRIYTDDGNGDGRLALNVAADLNLFEMVRYATALGSDTHVQQVPNNVLAIFAMPAANMVVASRKEMTEMYERMSSRALERLGTPLWERYEPLDADVEKLREGPFGRFRYFFIDLLLPAYDVLRYQLQALDGQREGVLIGLALELYHREEEKWPASLAELSPRWLPALPVDRVTGGPLHLKIVDDRPVVYSIGVDGKDDGGVLPAVCEGKAAPYITLLGHKLGLPESPPAIEDGQTGDWVIWSAMKQIPAMSE